MRFSQVEKTRLLEYVSENLTKSCHISIEEAKNMVYSSILVDKIESSPTFIAHCSMGQLVDMVKKEKNLLYI